MKNRSYEKDGTGRAICRGVWHTPILDTGQYSGKHPVIVEVSLVEESLVCDRRGLLPVFIEPLTHACEGIATFCDRATYCLDRAREIVGVGGVKRLERIDLSQ